MPSNRKHQSVHQNDGICSQVSLESIFAACAKNDDEKWILWLLEDDGDNFLITRSQGTACNSRCCHREGTRTGKWPPTASNSFVISFVYTKSTFWRWFSAKIFLTITGENEKRFFTIKSRLNKLRCRLLVRASHHCQFCCSRYLA